LKVKNSNTNKLCCDTATPQLLKSEVGGSLESALITYFQQSDPTRGIEYSFEIEKAAGPSGNSVLELKQRIELVIEGIKNMKVRVGDNE